MILAIEMYGRPFVFLAIPTVLESTTIDYLLFCYQADQDMD